MSELSILYKEDGLVVVNKPPRIAVHRSAATANDVKFLLQELRNQLDCHVHPIHRLDRGTSGCILFATRQEWVPELSKQFQDNQVQKQYQAIVRGHAPETIEVDYALKVKNGKKKIEPQFQEAFTNFVTEETFALNDKHPTQFRKYSLVKAFPKTGRRHQIRRHLKQISHPIIGDVAHGDRNHNHYFENYFKNQQLLLHAKSLQFKHPETQKNIYVEAPFFHYFEQVIKDLREYSVK